jgi:hypothetical protein
VTNLWRGGWIHGIPKLEPNDNRTAHSARDRDEEQRIAGQDQVKAPEPGVPELFTIKGEFVRIAYNNEGYASLGYRVANHSAGKEWMLLEMGATLRDGVENCSLKREDLWISTPDGGAVSLATQKEYREAPEVRALERVARDVRDLINYFPPKATRPCRLGFFADLDSRGPVLSYDETELSSRNACLGRVFFKVPGGIQYGQHWLNVRFPKSVVRVPFRILTEEEEEKFRDSWQDIKKEHEKRFKK